MQIRRFYCPDLTPDSKNIQLPDSESVHALRVLRMHPGDPLMLLNGNGLTAQAVISDDSTGKKAVCAILSCENTPHPKPELHLFVAPPHTKAFDLVLKTASELGVASITPIISQFSIAKPDGRPDAWQATLISAMKQSINPWLPRLYEPVSFAKALESCEMPGIFGATPHHGIRRNQASSSGRALSVWVGPEGGFSPDEENALLAKEFLPISIGPYVLRVETAVPSLLTAAYLLNHDEDI